MFIPIFLRTFVSGLTGCPCKIEISFIYIYIYIMQITINVSNNASKIAFQFLKMLYYNYS